MRKPLSTIAATELVSEYLNLKKRSLKLDKLMMIEDPEVQQTYAIRAYLNDSSIHDFLLVGQAVRSEPSWEDLEEVEFENWPPKRTSTINIVDFIMAHGGRS